MVVGGGRVAARKAEWLARAGAHVTVIAPELLPELQAQVGLGRLRHCAASFAPEHLDGAALVVAATDEPAVNLAVSDAARVRGIPVNVVDQAELSTFIFPAIVDRSPLIVAVSSAGAAPVLARRVRESLEALLPARLGALARFMVERRRQVRRALGALLARRAFWESIVSGPVAERLLGRGGGGRTGLRTRAAQLAAQQRARRRRGRSRGGLPHRAGPGDPELLTLRALQLLQQADVILYDRLVPEAILERVRRDAVRISVGKESGDSVTQERINELLVEPGARGPAGRAPQGR